MGHSRPAFLKVLAQFFTEVLNPFVLVAVLLALVAWETDPRWGQTAFISVLFISVIPMMTSLVMVRFGKTTDKYIRHRTQRHAYYAISLVSILLGAVLIFMLDTSNEARWMLAFSVGTMLIVMAINSWLKISFHALMAAVFALVVSVGTASIWATLLCLVIWCGVSWSRVFLSRHSFTEVASGSALGCVVGLAYLGAVGHLPWP